MKYDLDSIRGPFPAAQRRRAAIDVRGFVDEGDRMQIFREHDAHRHGDLIVLKLRGRISPIGDSDAIDLGSLYGPDVFGRTVAFDLREAEFLGSSGVNWLLTQRKEFIEAGGRMAICCTEGGVLDVLRLMRLDRLFAISESPEAIPTIDPRG